MEIYDVVPRFCDHKESRDLDGMIRSASGRIKGIDYTVTVTAATIPRTVIETQADGTKKKVRRNIGSFPGVREEFVEKAIRKISTYSSRIEPDRCVVSFTLYELKKELMAFGHDYRYDEIREALNILTHSRIQIVTTDSNQKTIDHISGYLNNLEVRSSNRKSKFYDPELAALGQARCTVELHKLLSMKISEGQFRLYQYGIDMSLTSTYARNLLRHLSLVWTNARVGTTFRLSLNDFITNILAREKTPRIYNDFRKLDEAVKGLVQTGLLEPDYKAEPVKAPKGKGFTDYNFEFLPTNRFVTSVIEAGMGVSQRPRQLNA